MIYPDGPNQRSRTKRINKIKDHRDFLSLITEQAALVRQEYIRNLFRIRNVYLICTDFSRAGSVLSGTFIFSALIQSEKPAGHSDPEHARIPPLIRF